jgi:hypothetical protein
MLSSRVEMGKEMSKQTFTKAKPAWLHDVPEPEVYSFVMAGRDLEGKFMASGLGEDLESKINRVRGS